LKEGGFGITVSIEKKKVAWGGPQICHTDIVWQGGLERRGAGKNELGEKGGSRQNETRVAESISRAKRKGHRGSGSCC